MSITAQNVVNGVSQDIRSVLASSGADGAILLDYVDRTHKDLLHDSIYSHLNQGFEVVNTVNGTKSYTLSSSSVRDIYMVYDRTKQRLLLPAKQMIPAPGMDKSDFMLNTLTGQAAFYKLIGTTSMHLFPTPLQVQALDVHYDLLVSTLAGLSTTLTIPEDGLDCMIAGTNSMAFAFLKKSDEAAMWQAQYERLKRGAQNS